MCLIYLMRKGEDLDLKVDFAFLHFLTSLVQKGNIWQHLIVKSNNTYWSYYFIYYIRKCEYLDWLCIYIFKFRVKDKWRNIMFKSADLSVLLGHGDIRSFIRRLHANYCLKIKTRKPKGRKPLVNKNIAICPFSPRTIQAFFIICEFSPRESHLLIDAFRVENSETRSLSVSKASRVWSI